MKLLIADDEEYIRRGLLTLDWNSVGICEILAAENGIAAKETLQSCNIDILVSDIRMPGYTGLELAEYLSTHACDTKVILLTGFGDFAYAQSAIRSGVSDYLLKPIDPGLLLATVKRSVQSLELERESSAILRLHREKGRALSFRQQITSSFPFLGDNTREILGYIADHYRDPLTLQELAEQYHFNPIHISRMIKKETGYSFVTILTGIRLIVAARLLRDPGTKVSGAGIQAGFNDPRYFSQVFKRVFGCTPMEYRKQRSAPKEYALLELLEKMSDDK